MNAHTTLVILRGIKSYHERVALTGGTTEAADIYLAAIEEAIRCVEIADTGSEMEYINAPKIPPERWHNGETDRPDNTAPQRAAQALWDEVVMRGTPPEEIRAAFRTVCEYLLIPYIFE